MRQKHKGQCALCGSNCNLSYEHIQPESCGNDKPITIYNLDDYQNGEIYKENGKAKGRFISQRGFGGYTLCMDCNSFAGSHYINSYKSFYLQCKSAYMTSKKSNITFSLKNIYPQRIIKAILFMFVSINKDGILGEKFKEFLLDEDCNDFPFPYQLYMYFTETSRFFPFILEGFKDGQIRNYSHISFPPIGFVLSKNDLAKSENLAQITTFRNYLYNEVENLSLSLKVINDVIPFRLPIF